MHGASSRRPSLCVALLLACVVVTLAAPAAAATFETALIPERVSAHGWFFQGEPGMAGQANRGFMSNAGFVVTSDAVVVFDALGTPPLGRAMIAAIRTVTALPIRRVIVSHYHADHVYGLQELKAKAPRSGRIARARSISRRGWRRSGSRSGGPISRRGSTRRRASCRPTFGSTAMSTSGRADSRSDRSGRVAGTRRRT